ncbi:MAG TPA: hypothetical protein VFF15_07680 [Flavobacteriaceae bacterium]|nr:hypothetical protein [Flavobacteriaceae bacterium]
MKKLYLIVFWLFLTLVYVSCTPAPLEGDAIKSEDCCGEDGEMQPPPPPSDSGG